MAHGIAPRFAAEVLRRFLERNVLRKKPAQRKFCGAINLPVPVA
jgi:hypothetical protein